MVSRSEPTITPGKRAVQRTFYFDADTFPAVLAAADLLHASDVARFAEDALVEALYDTGVLNVPRAPLMPRAEALQTSDDVNKALVAVEQLMAAVGNRMATQRRSPFLLRGVTLAHAKHALGSFPKQKKFSWPAAPRRREDKANKANPLHVAVTLHPRLEMALEQWTAELSEETPRTTRSFLFQRAVRMKLTNLGVNPVDHFKNPKLELREPHFVRFPHAEATFETRAMEERFLALIQALEAIAAAAPQATRTANFTAAVERLIAVAESASRLE